MTDDQQHLDADEEQSFQFQLRHMLLVTLVAALFFGLLGSVPGGILVATAGTVACGTWILLNQRVSQFSQFSSTQADFDWLDLAVATFLLECLLCWTTGFLGFVPLGWLISAILALLKSIWMLAAGITAIGSLWRIRRRRHGLVHTVILFAATAGFLPLAGFPAAFAGHLHHLYAFEGPEIAAECLQLIRDENRQGNPLPPTVARLAPIEVEVLPDSVKIENTTTRYTFEKLDSNGNWVLRVYWFMPGKYRTIATVHEDEFR